LIGIAIGGAIGVLTALGAWLAHQCDKPSADPKSNNIGITDVLDLASLPGVLFEAAIHGYGVAPQSLLWADTHYPTLTSVLCNALGWAALVAVLLAWPGPVFAALIVLIGVWGLFNDAVILTRRRIGAGRSKAELHT
jgi:hypothetical protein